MSVRLPMWIVTVAAHDVPRWHVPAHTVKIGARTAGIACSFVVRWAHVDAGVPPWKPCVRLSLRFARAERARSEGS